MEEEEFNTDHNANNMNMDTFCHQSPVTTNKQGEIANVTHERQKISDILAVMIKGFNGLMIQSTINDSVYYNLEEYDAEIDPNRNSKVAIHTSDRKIRKVTDTDTTNRNSSSKLFINQITTEIIPVEIPPIDQTIAEDAAESGETLYARHRILSKEFVTDAVLSTACVFWTYMEISRHDTDWTTTQDGNPDIGFTRLASLVRIGGSTTGSPSRTGSQYIIIPRGSIGPQRRRDSQPLETSINGIYSKHRYPDPTWSKVIVHKFTNKSSSNIYPCCRMNLMRDAVLTKSPKICESGDLVRTHIR